MRTIGNIERFLVLGIVVVIGVILVIAINGARDLDKEREQVAAKSAAGEKKAALPPKRDAQTGKAPAGPNDRPKEPARDGPAGGRRNPPVDPNVQKLLDARDAALAGKPAASPVNPTASTAAKPPVADAPLVVEESRPLHATPLERSDSPAPLQATGGTLNRPVESPAPAMPPAATKRYVYEVQRGDALERIARTLYGDGLLWKEIAAANPSIEDGQAIRAGDLLKLPRAPLHDSAFVVARDGATGAAPPRLPAATDRTAPAEPREAAATGFRRTTGDEQYEVRRGDTLMSIAAANYGTKAAWRLILQANSDKIPDKDRIRTGTVLKLPVN